MRGVVRQVVTRDPVHKHIQALALALQPGNDAIELRAVERQLAAPARVRPDFALMHAARTHMEQLTGPACQRARLLHRVRPEIDVGVVVAVDVLGALDHGGHGCWGCSGSIIAAWPCHGAGKGFACCCCGLLCLEEACGRKCRPIYKCTGFPWKKFQECNTEEEIVVAKCFLTLN